MIFILCSNVRPSMMSPSSVPIESSHETREAALRLAKEYIASGYADPQAILAESRVELLNAAQIRQE